MEKLCFRHNAHSVLRRVVLTLAAVVCALTAMAQSAVSGTVVDEAGEAVLGANVRVKGGATGAVTDINGAFTLPAVKAGAMIEISYVGYLTKTIAAKEGMRVVLEEDRHQLEELVVVGYGVQKKTDVTGAMLRVGEKELNSKPVSNALEALQGKAAGVDITSSQRPGTLGSIRIRGNRSLNASNSPLYVVDGVPLSSGGIETINPRDIEAIDILKDASSTAIYGSRGANGVVLVTTKRGKTGSMQLNYSGSVTFETLKDKTESMSAADYITWRRWAYYNSNPTKYTPGDQPVKEQDEIFFAASGDDAAYNNVMRGWEGGTWDASRVQDTDWADIVTRTGITHEHTLSGSGGTDKIQGSFSFGYLDNRGTQRGQEYERFNFASSIDIQAKPWFKMGGSVNASYGKQDYGYSRTAQSSSSGPTEIYTAARAIPRYAVPYDANGDIVTQPAGSVTGVYTVQDEWAKSTDERKTFRMLASLYAQIDFGKIWQPLAGLTYKIAFGPDFRQFRQGIFIDATSAVRMGSTNYSTRAEERHFSYTLDNMITYNREFGKHNIGVTLLQSASKYDKENSSMHEEAIPLPSMLWNNMGYIDITQSKFKASMGTGLTQNQLASYMARVNYSYNDRYLLTVSGRYDGSSVLAEGNKWSFFPSAALGWRMEQEDFLKNVSWINQLKVRVGVGVTGNSSVDPYGTLGVISSYWMPFSTGNYNILVTNEPYYTSGSNKMPNKNLGWEKTTQWNFGVDFSFLKGRLGGTLDVYTSKTSDLLMTMTIPSLSGYPSMMDNVGKTKNWGYDLTLTATPVVTNGFQWDSSLSFAYQKDQIVELSNGKEDDINNAWFIGESISVYYGYDNAGLWQESDKEEMDKFNANGEKFEAGKVRPVDQNGDYKINADDRVILGNRNPRYTMGWTNTFSWKGLELGIELYGRFKYLVDVGGQGQGGIDNQIDISYWTPANTGADYQKPIFTGAKGVSGDAYSGLLGFQNANFIKLRNISLGYNLPSAVCKNIGIANAKIYFQARNLGMLYSSIDVQDLDLGASFYNRGFTVGLQVGF